MSAHNKIPTFNKGAFMAKEATPTPAAIDFMYNRDIWGKVCRSSYGMVTEIINKAGGEMYDIPGAVDYYEVIHNHLGQLKDIRVYEVNESSRNPLFVDIIKVHTSLLATLCDDELVQDFAEDLMQFLGKNPTNKEHYKNFPHRGAFSMLPAEHNPDLHLFTVLRKHYCLVLLCYAAAGRRKVDKKLVEAIQHDDKLWEDPDMKTSKGLVQMYLQLKSYFNETRREDMTDYLKDMYGIVYV